MNNTRELWIEYDRLCDLAETAAQTDPMASHNWAERLQAARSKAVAAENAEHLASDPNYPYRVCDICKHEAITHPVIDLQVCDKCAGVFFQPSDRAADDSDERLDEIKYETTLRNGG